VQVHLAAWMSAACPQALDPPLLVILLTGRDVIPFIGRPPEAEGAKRLVKLAGSGFEAGHGDLKIEDILGRHARDGGAADVVDPLGPWPYLVPQGRDEGRGAAWPVGGVVNDHRALGVRTRFSRPLSGRRFWGVHGPTVAQRRTVRDRADSGLLAEQDHVPIGCRVDFGLRGRHPVLRYLEDLVTLG
jgi:hypothetical protein